MGDNPKSSWKKLTSQEMAERRAKWLCFNCDEAFSIGHRCKRLFHIILCKEDEVDNLDEIEISLNAIKGEHTTSMFRFQWSMSFSMSYMARPSSPSLT